MAMEGNELRFEAHQEGREEDEFDSGEVLLLGRSTLTIDRHLRQNNSDEGQVRIRARLQPCHIRAANTEALAAASARGRPGRGSVRESLSRARRQREKSIDEPPRLEPWEHPSRWA